MGTREFIGDEFALLRSADDKYLAAISAASETKSNSYSYVSMLLSLLHYVDTKCTGSLCYCHVLCQEDLRSLLMNKYVKLTQQLRTAAGM